MEKSREGTPGGVDPSGASSPTGGHSLAAFRVQLLSQGVKPCALLNLGCVLAGVVKSLAAGREEDLPALVLHCAPIYLPVAAIAAGYDARIVPVCALSHALTSLILVCTAYQLVPFVDVVQYVFVSQYEVLTTGLLAHQYQLSLSLMALLNALRVYTWYLISVRCLFKDPKEAALRRLADWALLMAVHGAYAVRTWYMYTRTCKSENVCESARVSMDGCELKQLPAADAQTQQPAAAEPPAEQHTSTASARTTLLSDSDVTLSHSSAATASVRDMSSTGGISELHGGNESTSTVTVSTLSNDGIVRAEDAGKGREQGITTLAAAVAMLPGSVGLVGIASVPDIARLAARMHRPYLRKPKYAESQFHIKLVDIHMDELSPDFATDFQRQLRPCMPGMHMCGAVVRPGCVLMTLDVIREEPDAEAAVAAEAAAANMLGEVAGAIRTSGGQMRDGALVYCQLPDGRIAVSTWDAASSEFRHSDAGVLPANVLQLSQQGALCSLQLLGPHVQCVPLTSGMQTTLPLRITAPCNSRLMGWQPRGAAVSAEDTALRLHAEGESTHSDAPDVSVLVRRVNGQYMPVTLRQTGTLESDGTCATVGVEATVTLHTYEPCGLRVELWVKGVRDTVEGRSPPELLCASFPLVVLPSHWEAAATELQAHVATLGSVQTSTPLCDTTVSEPPQAAADVTADAATDLLTDITLWLSLDVEGSGAGVHTARLSEDLGRTLVYYTVQWGMVEVSQLLMTTMSGRAGVAGSTVVGWFARLASQVPSREETGGHTSEGGGLSEWESDDTLVSLIHVACYSSSPDMLEKVLRWGLVYGGGVWRWPWLLEDKRGRTPLHLIAARPDPTVCIPMLETLRRMLTLRELQAAYAAWSECTGGVNVTPMQCFAQAHPESVPAAQRVWADVANTQLPGTGSSSTMKQARSVAELAAEAAAAASGPGGSRASTATAAASPAAGSEAASRTHSWLQAVRDVWHWSPSAEYQAWSKMQLSGIVQSWAWSIVCVMLACYVQSYRNGALRHEWGHLTLHALPYYALVSMVMAGRFLDCWQGLMPGVPVFHTLGYLYLALVDNTVRPTWTNAARLGTDCIYTVLVAAFEQNTLPYTALSRAFMAITQGLAFSAAGVPMPFVRSIAVQCICVALCALVRAYQHRAYQCWREAVMPRSKSGEFGVASPMSRPNSPDADTKKTQ